MSDCSAIVLLTSFYLFYFVIIQKSAQSLVVYTQACGINLPIPFLPVVNLVFWGYIYVIYMYIEKHIVFFFFIYRIFLYCFGDLPFSLTFFFVVFPCQLHVDRLHFCHSVFYSLDTLSFT